MKVIDKTSKKNAFATMRSETSGHITVELHDNYTKVFRTDKKGTRELKPLKTRSAAA